MTNYNERLDEILSKTPCSQCNGSGAYPDYDGEPEQCQFCWQLRFTFIDETKQALTKLIKELVAEAKPAKKDQLAQSTSEDESRSRFYRYGGYNFAIDEFEQNLLKALEE